MIQLREDQDKAVSDLRQALMRSTSVLLRAPCRFGKTVVSAYIARATTAKGKRIIFACHRDSILTQTAKTFRKFEVKHGIIAAGYGANPFALAQVASADTLRNRLEALKGCALLVVDESHLWHSRTRKLIIDAAKEAGCKILGLTATPIRLDGKPLGDLFDEMVMGPDESWLIERGHLARYRAYAPSRPDLQGITSSGKDYNSTSAREKLDKPAIRGDAVETWKKYALGLRTVVYAIDRKHGRNVLETYRAAGVAVEYIDGETLKSEKTRIINALADGKIHVLVSVELLTTGFDLSSYVDRDVSVQCVQLLRPTKSLQLAIQMMMRCMTAQEGDAIILDHVNIILNTDGTTNHGFPDDEREWSLEGRDGRASDGVPALNVKQCESCFAAYRAALPACPYCSSERVVKERKVEQLEAEIVEIQRKAQAKRTMRAARDLDSVARVAVERGYKPAWVAIRMKTLGQPVTFSKAMEAYADAKTAA